MRAADAVRISVRGEFAASISHEITEPLSAMAMNGETGLRWLGRAEPNVAKARELLQRIVEGARRAAKIVGRIQAGAAGTQPAPSPHDTLDAAPRHAP